MDNTNLSAQVCTGDIETNPVGDVTLDEPVSSHVNPSEGLETIDNLKLDETKNSVPDDNSETKRTRNGSLDDVIIKALEKVKDYFFQNEIEEHKLAEFMYKILTLNTKDVDPKGVKPEMLDNFVEQIVETCGAKNDSDTLNELLEGLFGKDKAKSICDKLCTENIDEIVESILGKDTKNIICDRLESDNLDDLLNKLIDEKLTIHGNPQAKHPNFDDFIEKILGKETKEFIRQKLQAFLNENDSKENVLVVEDVE